MGAPDSLNGKGKYHLILFDGVCNLCTGSVQFIIKRDKKEKFKFASLQSSIGQHYLKRFSKKSQLESILLIKNDRLYDRSTAALEITKELSGLWPALYIFKIIPKFLRDLMYDLVAKNRYRMFGKKNECMIPTPELKARFLTPLDLP